jgi:hypothetical protein
VKVAGPTALVIVLALSLGLSACDPAPLAELRNNSGQAVVLRSVTVIHGGVFDTGRAQDATIASSRTVRFFPWEPIRIRTGQCELTYALPDLPTFVGMVFPFEIRPDLKLYLRALKRPDLRYQTFALDAQPPGWPLQPAENSCQEPLRAGG